MEDQDPPSLSKFLTFRLSRVQAKLNSQANAILQHHSDLTLSQWRVLSLVGAFAPTQMSQVAKKSTLDKGLLSRNLKNLIADGLVSSEQDAKDQRVHHLDLTANGQSVYDKVLPIMQKRQAFLRAAMSEDEFESFLSGLDKLEVAAENRDDV